MVRESSGPSGDTKGCALRAHAGHVTFAAAALAAALAAAALAAALAADAALPTALDNRRRRRPLHAPPSAPTAVGAACAACASRAAAHAPRAPLAAALDSPPPAAPSARLCALLHAGYRGRSDWRGCAAHAAASVEASDDGLSFALQDGKLVTDDASVRKLNAVALGNLIPRRGRACRVHGLDAIPLNDVLRRRDVCSNMASVGRDVLSKRLQIAGDAKTLRFVSARALRALFEAARRARRSTIATPTSLRRS